MEKLVYNPQKGRNETIVVEYTDENTTWFDDCTKEGEIYMITDWKGNLLIREYGYTYPILIYSMTRADIDYDQEKAMEVLRLRV